MLKKETILATAGRPPHGPVNVPVMRASTILFEDMDSYESTRDDRFEALRYGLHGTETHFALERVLTEFEGCHRAIIVPSGLAAATAVLLTLLSPGDHLLVADSVYGPVRSFIGTRLAAMGVTHTFFDPNLADGIEQLFQPNTKLVYCESPGSFTFEVQDIPAIVRQARRHGIKTVIDNTWASPLFFDAMVHGVDISIQAATKHISGHSDFLMGVIATTAPLWKPVRETVADLGFSVSADDCFLALRGLRTLSLRLRRQNETALKVAGWLRSHPAITEVLYPPLEGAPGHALWKRDFKGGCGLMGVVVKPDETRTVRTIINSLRLFRIGASWGGFESLALPGRFTRVTEPPCEQNHLLRLYTGLEDPDDLISDLANALGPTDAPTHSAEQRRS